MTYHSCNTLDTLAETEIIYPKMWGNKLQWISHKINIRRPGQLKKTKTWEPFWSYQLNSTANPAHLPQNWAKFAKFAKLAKLAKLAVLLSW